MTHQKAKRKPTEPRPTQPPEPLPRLTDTQAETLVFISDYIDADRLDRSPTLRQIAAHFGVAKITVWERIDALKGKGVLIGEQSAAHSLQVTDIGRSVVEAWKGQPPA